MDSKQEPQTEDSGLSISESEGNDVVGELVNERTRKKRMMWGRKVQHSTTDSLGSTDDLDWSLSKESPFVGDIPNTVVSHDTARKLSIDGSITHSSRLSVVPVMGGNKKQGTVVFAMNQVNEDDLDNVKPWKEQARTILESSWIQGFLMLILLVGLFLADVNQMAFSPDTDHIVYTSLLVIMGFFALELVANSLFIPHYVGSFFFWMDLLGTLSIIVDVPWIFNEIVPESSTAAGNGTMLRAGKAARAGAKMGRFLRIFRFFKLLRVMRTFKFMDKKIRESKKEEQNPTFLGTEYAESLSKRVMLGVVIILLVSPFLTELTVDTGPSLGLDMLDTLAPGPDLDAAIAAYSDEDHGLGEKLLSLQLDGVFYIQDLDTLSDRRDREIAELTTDSGSVAIIDLKESLDEVALNQILTIIFVVCFLFIAGAILNRDANRMVVGPIERMVKVVRRLTETLQSLQSSTEATANDTVYETHFLETAIEKMAALLRVGFGEAGASIIGKNLAEGNFNAMVPGTKVRAVFGFCDIRQFTDTTECLQEDVLVFVNAVAEIVHHHVTVTGGAPNKNVGDAFLAVWKLDQRVTQKDIDNARTVVDNEEVADSSLTCFLNVIQALEFGFHPVLDKLLENDRVQKVMPNQTIKMGFGLHVGWAIEGAIGSNNKIDASYLSPHVNLSSRLEAATKQYGVPILMSDEFFNMLSPEMRLSCRKIDRVTVKGSKLPMTLYTVEPQLVLSESEALSPLFLEQWDLVMQHYLGGTWEEARIALEVCRKDRPDDGPSATLWEFMENAHFMAPDDWDGFRPLLEK